MTVYSIIRLLKGWISLIEAQGGDSGGNSKCFLHRKRPPGVAVTAALGLFWILLAKKEN